MKLWLLLPVDGLNDLNNPWEPWYDKAFGFVVRAESELEAREMASRSGGDEVERGLPNPWEEPSLSTCVELTADGECGVVMRDFAAA